MNDLLFVVVVGRDRVSRSRGRVWVMVGMVV